jgi:dehydrogenase/reductase SDR family protein 7B
VSNVDKYFMRQESRSSGRVKIVPFDLADLSGIDAAVSKIVACHGHVDIVINNGGLSYRGSIAETALEVDVSVMNVNYFGQVAVTKGSCYIHVFINVIVI